MLCRRRKVRPVSILGSLVRRQSDNDFAGTTVRMIGERIWQISRRFDFREVPLADQIISPLRKIRMNNDRSPSKFISLILRHRPEIIGITLDEHGWADVSELITGISRSHQIDRETLERIVA